MLQLVANKHILCTSKQGDNYLVMSTLKSRDGYPCVGVGRFCGVTSNVGQKSHPYLHDLKGDEIENQLATRGVLDPEWRSSLVGESIGRIEAQLRSDQDPITPAERNDLVNRRLTLMQEFVLGVTSPVPVFGQHPACSRPVDAGVPFDADTSGSGD